VRIWQHPLAVFIACVLLGPPDASAQGERPIPNGRVMSGSLSFDGHATAGDFVGTTTTVSGQLAGAAALTGVRGWVEAPVRTLKTGNGKRDKDLNKSMESDKYPVIRFELARISRTGGERDSIGVILHGALVIHGVIRDVDLPGFVRLSGSTARVRTDFPLNLKDYRIGGLSKMLGILKMHENIEVHADLVFQLGPGG
jgi:polyisoprenoid-binding protein YceI